MLIAQCLEITDYPSAMTEWYMGGVCLRDSLALLFYVTPARGLQPHWDKYLIQYEALDQGMKACLEEALEISEGGAMTTSLQGARAETRTVEVSMWLGL